MKMNMKMKMNIKMEEKKSMTMMRKRFTLFGAMIEVNVPEADEDMIHKDQRQETRKTTTNATAAASTSARGGSSSSSRNQQQQQQPPREREPAAQLQDLPAGARLVTKKRLEDSDVSSAQSRLMITNREAMLELMTQEERVRVLEEKQTMKVAVVDARNRHYLVDFKLWPSLKKLILNKKWMELVENNQLLKGDVVQLWAYRNQDRLRFALEVCHRTTTTNKSL